MDERDIILECECREPGGTVVRTVRLGHLSVERMKFLWDKLSKFDVLFNDFVKGDFEAFVRHFIVQVDGQPEPAGLLWDIDDVGIILVNNIVPFESASAHFVFWDGRFRGRENLIREMLKYGFKTYKFRRIKVEVPLYAQHTKEVVERIGFIQEGRMRKAALWKGTWFDVNLFSILPEDLEENPRRFVWGRHYATCLECGDIHSVKNKEKKRHSRSKEGVTHGWAKN